MKPMLAHRYKEYRSRMKFPQYVQPKLNGVRMMYRDGQCMSRDQHMWHESVLKHITDALRPLGPSVILDGELYVHGWSLQQINAACAVNRKEPSAKSHLIEYHVFDMIHAENPMLPFESRWFFFVPRITGLESKCVKSVATYYISNAVEGETHYKRFKDEGYEGMMYRIPDAPYGFVDHCGNKENRWDRLIKRKDWLDDEFDVVGFNTTVGDKGEKGFQLRCRAKNGIIFTVGSGLSDMEIEDIERDPSILDCAIVRVRYEMLSDAGVPLKPTIDTLFPQ